MNDADAVARLETWMNRMDCYVLVQGLVFEICGAPVAPDALCGLDPLHDGACDGIARADLDALDARIIRGAN